MPNDRDVVATSDGPEWQINMSIRVAIRFMLILFQHGIGWFVPELKSAGVPRWQRFLFFEDYRADSITISAWSEQGDVGARYSESKRSVYFRHLGVLIATVNMTQTFTSDRHGVRSPGWHPTRVKFANTVTAAGASDWIETELDTEPAEWIDATGHDAQVVTVILPHRAE